MKNKLHSLVIVLALFAGVHQAAAQEARFFRISGPVATTITEVHPDGTLVWTNAPTNATFTVQMAASLAGDGNWVDYVQLLTTNAFNTNRLIDPNPPAGMALIPAGTFTMGDTVDGVGDAPPMSIYVSQFYMDVNLVSYSQWQSVCNYATDHGYSFVNAGAGKAANHPVQTVSWYDCVKWSNARSQQAGLTPVYFANAEFTQVFKNEADWSPVYMNLAANGYRLPTEAEWEKAARGGLSGHRFPWGNTNTISENQANYFSIGGGNPIDSSSTGYNPTYEVGGYPYTNPGGAFAPNGYGLFDMAGNVWEWCWDWYEYAAYGQPTTNNPTGPSGFGYRVLRGGSWHYDAWQARCANRYDLRPDKTNDDKGDGIGFRCVRGQ